MFRDELAVGRGTVLADAKNGDVVVLELIPTIAEVASFLRAAGSVVFGIEVQNNFLPLQRRQADGFSVLIRKGEVGGDVADLQAYGRIWSENSAYGVQDKIVCAAYVANQPEAVG